MNRIRLYSLEQLIAALTKLTKFQQEQHQHLEGSERRLYRRSSEAARGTMETGAVRNSSGATQGYTAAAFAADGVYWGRT